MKWRHGVNVLFVFLFSQQVSAEVMPDGCQANGWSRERLQLLKETVPPDADVQALALQLRHCLASSDPILRDELAFGLLSTWMRTERLTVSTRTQLFSALTHDIEKRNDASQGVYLPFALLTLSEILRTDRLAAFLDDKQRGNVVRIVSSYLSALSDYRGFSNDVGWRHNVAHGADVYLQLGLNKRVSAQQVSDMADSLAGLINPSEVHFYHYGEPQRLARASAYLMLREDTETEYWLGWLSRVASPMPFEAWRAVFTSQSGLAKRHNVRAFLLELNRIIGSSSKPRLKAISKEVELHLSASA